ncbi:MAG: PEP-CTERM sorting domain-containing protein [Desulfuromonadaceae bacterium]|nr:PEP-CTERM sorting domain-containing protein [Desulfuromonadaceae bacterium]
MKTRKIATILAAAALTLAMSVASAMAFDFSISGYTATLDVATTDANYTPPAGSAMGPADAFTGGTGYYSISFFGGTGDFTNASGLHATMSLAGDASSSVGSYYSGLLLDTFAITTINGVFTLSSLENGNLLQFNLLASPLDPNWTNVGAADALANANGFAYINQVFLDSNGAPYAYGPDGLLLSPTVAYGSIMADGFLAATAAGTFIDMVVDDANIVPEPSTFLLLGAGLSGLAFWRRRKA